MTLRSERGQTTAMVVTMLWVLVFFVAVVADVGQAVNRKVALQMLADYGAYTGGTVMATGFNHLAYWNRHIQRMFAWMTISSDGFTANICGCSPIIPFVCDEWTVPGYATAMAMYTSTDINFGMQLQERPQKVTRWNARDLFPGEEWKHLEMSSRDMSQEAGMILNPYLTGDLPILIGPMPVSSGTSPKRGKPKWGSETPFDYLPPIDPPFSFADSSYFETWTSICFPDSWDMASTTFWFKLPRFGPAYYFPWIVTAPPTKAIMFDSIIGPEAIPAMKAVGVTKPVGGNIEKGEIGYKVKVVNANKAMLFRLVRDSLYKGPGGIKLVTH